MEARTLFLESPIKVSRGLLTRYTVSYMRRGRPHTKDSLARNLKYLMDLKDWRQAKVSSASGVSQKTISNMLNGVGTPKLDSVEAVANAFGLNGWHLIMPDLPDELISSPSLERLVTRYVSANEDGRKFIDQVAEREAEYRSGSQSATEENNGANNGHTPDPAIGQ